MGSQNMGYRDCTWGRRIWGTETAHGVAEYGVQRLHMGSQNMGYRDCTWGRRIWGTETAHGVAEYNNNNNNNNMFRTHQN